MEAIKNEHGAHQRGQKDYYAHSRHEKKSILGPQQSMERVASDRSFLPLCRDTCQIVSR